MVAFVQRAIQTTAALSYFGVSLSENMEMTDEGYLICKNAVVGRTGVQRYRFSDLPQDEARELEIDAAPEDLIDLYREPEFVFADEFLATLEGKPVTDQHPRELLTIDTHDLHDCGHIMRPRRGDVPLDSGDWPILADLMLTDKALIQKVHNGLRQLSLGYTFHIARDGNRILQVDMRGNHVAVLRAGRAGREACIQDEALPQETYNMAVTLGNIFGSWFKSNAATLTDEQAAEAIRLQHQATTAMDAAAKSKDEKTDEAREKKKEKEGGEGKDGKGGKGKDEEESDIERARRGRKGTDGKGKGKDDDDDDDEDDDEETRERKRRRREGQADDEQDPLELDVEDRNKPAAPGMDAAAVAFDMVEDLFSALRPAVAKSKDKAVRGAYTDALRDFRAIQGGYGADARGRRTDGITRAQGGYAAVSSAAGARGHDAAAGSDEGGDITTQMKSAYDRIRNGK